MVNLALLGAGRIREVHAQAVVDQAGCAVSAVEAVLPDSRVDSVVICPPTATYFDLIERFACADKAIFCERPIELDVARARARIDVIRETKGRHRSCLPLIVALIHISALCVRQLMLAGGVGKVEMLMIISWDPAPPPPSYIAMSSGIFCDMTIHDFDMVCFLLDE